MEDVDGDSTLIVSDNIPESVLHVDPVSVGLPLVSSLEPSEGMDFASFEDAKNYYTRYAENIGFSFRMGRVTKSRTNGMIVGQEIVCSREGFRAKKYAKHENCSHAKRNDTRVGCKAMLYVKKNEDRWIVSRFRGDHNHELISPGSSQHFRVHRKKTKVQNKLVDVLVDSGLGPSKVTSGLYSESGIDNVGFSQKDVINYLTVERQKQLGKEDAQLMLSYFRNCQLKNIGFFYAFQMDAKGQLANCFWVDSMSRMAYKYFGDAVTFESTYLTDEYKIPFVLFTGVNHHLQSILFGCALLWDKTEESFVWLLSTWLEAMDGVCPKTIMTEQDPAITNAVAKIFPEVNHHYCMWHIENKVAEQLNFICHEHNQFKNEFYKCIHHSTTIEEFNSDWEAMIEKYGLRDNHWLQNIHSIRVKWIPAYVRHNFCAGMSTTQRNGSLNKFFEDFLTSSSSLSKFMTQYEKALDAHYNKEREKTFKTMNSNWILRTLYPMEVEASNIYTRKIFKIFQDELVGSQMFIAEKVEFSTEVSTYKVHEIYKEKPYYYVTFHVISKEANCSCHMFEFWGILCRHVLNVFLKKKIFSLPSQYVLHRWTINAKMEKVKRLAVKEFHEGNKKASSSFLFNNVMVQSLQLSERASWSEKHYDVAVQGLQKLIAELDLLKFEESNDLLKLEESNEEFCKSDISSYA